MIVECSNCNKEVYKKMTQIKRSKNLFCNKECHTEFEKKKEYNKMCKLVKGDFKDWLAKKYHDEELPTRDISELLYGKRTNSPNVLKWMKNLNIPVRKRSDAVALQWKDNQERRDKQSEFLTELLTGKPSHRRRSRESLEKDLNAQGFILSELFIKDGYTYFDCECKKCGYETIKSLRNMALGRGCMQCAIDKRTFADQSTVRSQRSKTRPWRKSVLERDNYTCQCCGDQDELVAHHIECFARNEALRFEVYNGITLCKSCHTEFHRFYGYGDNNLLQLGQFIQMKLTASS